MQKQSIKKIKVSSDDQVFTSLCILECWYNAEAECGDEPSLLVERFNSAQSAHGICEVRRLIGLLAIQIEKAWQYLDAGDEIMDVYGCYDFEWIPAMLEAAAENAKWDNDAFLDTSAKFFVETTKAALKEAGL